MTTRRATERTGGNTGLLLAASFAAFALTGCGASLSTTTAPVSVVNEAKATGIVMGGQQAVGGVSLQIYAVGTTGYGSAATPLLAAGSTLTTPSGNFTLPVFTCPTPGALVYLTGTGGQPIAATQTTAAITNNNLAMMVGLGACSSVGSQFINVNEVTTVATVWALSPFMTGIDHVGSSASNSTGIANAFAAINQVANTTNGAVSGPALPSNASLPVAEINTIADILEQCVNSGGGSASDTTNGLTNGTGCGKLFYLAGGSGTRDTVTAAMQIAQNPSRNVSKLNFLRSSSPVFQPVIAVNSPPSDWTIGISYTGGGLSTPQGVATDRNGNVWVANSGGNSVSSFSSTGAALSPAAGITNGSINAPYALAVDQSGNVWIASSGNNMLTELNSAGSVLQTVSGNGLNGPMSVAVDGTGNVFVANPNAGVSGFTSAGGTLAGSPFVSGGVSSPSAIAVSPR